MVTMPPLTSRGEIGSELITSVSLALTVDVSAAMHI